MEEPVVRRSGRIRHRLDYYMERVSLAKDHLEEPVTVTEALKIIVSKEPIGRKLWQQKSNYCRITM